MACLTRRNLQAGPADVATGNGYYGQPYWVEGMLYAHTFPDISSALHAIDNNYYTDDYRLGCLPRRYTYYSPSAANNGMVANDGPSPPCGGSNAVHGTVNSFKPARNIGSGATCDSGDGDAAGNGKTSCNSVMAGDPINSSTGNKFQQEDDSIDAKYLAFRRFYNSQLDVVSGHMGAHWRNSYDRSLVFTDYVNGGSAITLLRPDGRQIVFSKTGDQWRSDPDVADRLVQLTDSQASVTGYSVFVSSLRQIESYSATGLLQSITDQAGVGIVLRYSDAFTDPAIAPLPGLLLAVTDPYGRLLQFGYDANGRVSTVLLPDGDELSYQYDNASGNLLSVQYPDGRLRSYAYNESAMTGGKNFTNALTAVVDELGVRYEETSYDSEARAIMSRRAGSVDTTRMRYFPVGYTTVTYPLGVAAYSVFSIVNGVLKASSIDTPCNPQCGNPWKTREYDANGYLSRVTDFNGNATETVYDDDGLLTKQVQGAGTTLAHTMDLTWDAARRLPNSRLDTDANGNLVGKTAWVFNSIGKLSVQCDFDVSMATDYECGTAPGAPASVRRTTYTYCVTIQPPSCFYPTDPAKIAVHERSSERTIQAWRAAR